jgi:hypothetical protein
VLHLVFVMMFSIQRTEAWGRSSRRITHAGAATLAQSSRRHRDPSHHVVVVVVGGARDRFREDGHSLRAVRSATTVGIAPIGRGTIKESRYEHD